MVRFLVEIEMAFPFVWPSGNLFLQLRLITCICILISVRVINVYVPIYYKKIVDTFSQVEEDPEKYTLESWPWHFVAIWITLKILQGGGVGDGLLGNLRDFLWIKVKQYASKNIQVKMFSHIHNLSLDWHMGRKSGEVMRIMDRGSSSINSVLRYLFFSIVPTLIDISIAVVYFCITFNMWFGLIIFIAMFLYLGLTVLITEWRTKFRRNMNLMENEQRTKALDSLLNAETVKYFSSEDWETERYSKSIDRYQKEEWRTDSSLVLLNIAQSLVLNIALLVLAIYCAHLVWEGKHTVGEAKILQHSFP